MAEILVIASKIKKAVKKADLRTGKDYIEALSAKVDGMIKAAVAKVKAEGKKKTLGAEDVI
ncbi:MAG: hypothetical protein WC976_07260 [Caldisericia bacterium]